MQTTSDPMPQLEHLTDRELLVLAVREINALKVELSILHNRLRVVENWRYALSGGIIVVGAMATWIMSKLP